MAEAPHQETLGDEAEFAGRLPAGAAAITVEPGTVRGLLDAAPDAMIVVDSGGRIVLVNSQTERMFGYKRGQLLGERVEKLVPESRREVHERHRDGFYENPHTRPMGAGLDLRARRRDGSEFPVEISLSPLRTEEGLLVTAAVRDITERRRSEEAREGERKRFEAQLQFLADHDALTGLFNSRRFIEELSRRLALTERYGRGGAVLVLDLDNFKEINDTAGHRAGDATIAAAGTLLLHRLRSTDVLARLGGDEFAVLLPEADEREATKVAGDLVEAVRAHPFLVEGRRARVTVSIGVALFDALKASETDQLLASADMAMYEAKEAGRDRLALYRPERGRELQLRSRVSWTQRIREALDGGGLSLVVQPILDLRSGRISQCEALVRLGGEEGELIRPGAFLPTAERSGLVTELDRWVIHEAVELVARERRDRDGVGPTLEVNLSGRSVTAELAGVIEAVVVERGVDPRSLIFEITETAAISNMEEARRLAAALARLGCRFALDDFGSGFGSFYYLKYLPLDFVKIDGDFIRNLPVSEVDQVLVRGIVEVARGLGIKTIAEFVQDAETLDLLRRYGVDYAQGYHVGRPRPASEGVACHA